MELIAGFLLDNGMTGVFILAVIYALRKIYTQNTFQNKENAAIENSFRTHLIENENRLLIIVQENTKAFREFTKNLQTSNNVINGVLEELKKRDYCHDCKHK